MNRLAVQEKERAQTARSAAATRPPALKAKMYVFGYRDEAEYIPHPFISSPRPKLPGDRSPRSARSDALRRSRKPDAPGKLSRRRHVDVDTDLGHSVFFGSFEQFTQQYRGP
jgi:hypothetical protein